MEKFIGTVRAWTRLSGLLVITVVTVARLKLDRLLGRNSLHDTAGFAQIWARTLIASLGVKLTVRGRPARGTVLYLANHRSYIDIPAILSQVPCAFLAKQEVGTWPVLGYATRLANTVFVNRECRLSRKAARAGAVNVLKQGLPFAAFPEGTTSNTPGALPFYNGMFEVAAEHGYRIVPVAIEYGDLKDAWIDEDPFAGHFLDRFSQPRLHVRVSFGPELSGRDAQELKLKTRSWILSRLSDGGDAGLDSLPVPAFAAEGMEDGLPMVA